MPTIFLGNIAPISKLTIPGTGQRVVVAESHIDQSTTVIHVPPDWPFDEALTNITKQTWPYMSSQPPVWVDGDDPGLVAALAASFGCPQGEPADWEIVFNDNPRPSYGAPMEAAQAALDSGIGQLEAPPVAAPQGDEAAASVAVTDSTMTEED